ncbi:glycosyltransferase family 4 protein [Desulfovibrio psychrotolerans]|uniref:Glycosyl transferase n=1 Tax=Desulfovibrio psychrotolerans TaxID=415242 RepID=A0A7J0BZ07_9BACT|nr:glycosyltransferase family 4 protein [Desulfovibrio psychrotolerans]GFM38425.1 glycosyl transferase [Desulfovibrio psychrotolerans]
MHPFFERGDIMGRSVANEGFIRALLRRDPFAAYHFYLSDAHQTRILLERLRDEFPVMLRNGRFVLGTYADVPRALATHDFHCFHLSDCMLHNAHLARLRNLHSRRIFPITGSTHSLSYARYMPMLLGQVWAGTSQRDAVLATSHAAVSMMETAFSRLRSAYGLPASVPHPRVEHVPLGIDCATLSCTAGSDTVSQTAASRDESAAAVARARMRTQLGVEEQDVLLLVFARISHYSKMDILPLLRALQRLARSGVPMRRLHLCVAGFLPQGDSTPQTLAGLASVLGVRMHVRANPPDAERNELYAAADVFVSPVDNLQETFGLSLLEAAASGLPVIASDFDGYRDLVVHGQTGLLIPTLGPAWTDDADTMANLAYDSATHLALAQRTVVDVGALADALRQLVESPALRRDMGQKGRARVTAAFGWDTVLDQYLACWERLNAVPVSAEGEQALRAAVHPLHMPYAELFVQYPSAIVEGAMQVVWTAAGEAVYRNREQPVIYEGIAASVDPETLRHMLFLARRGIPVARLCALLAERGGQASSSGSRTDSRTHEALVLWALKHDFLERV